MVSPLSGSHCLRLRPILQVSRYRAHASRASAHSRLWEDQIEITPVFGGSRAFAGPIRIVVEMIGHLRGPETSDVAIVDVALHRLAEPGRTTGRIHFPTRRKRKRAAHGNVRPGRRLRWDLQRDHVIVRRRELAGNAAGFLVQGSQVFHDAFLSANNLKNSGLWTLIAA